MSTSGEGLVGEGWEVWAPTRVQTASRSFARSGLLQCGRRPAPAAARRRQVLEGQHRPPHALGCAGPLVSGWAQGAQLAFAPGGELAGKLHASPGMVPSVGQVMPLAAP